MGILDWQPYDAYEDKQSARESIRDARFKNRTRIVDEGKGVRLRYTIYTQGMARF